jgi:hypothetical protein
MVFVRIIEAVAGTKKEATQTKQTREGDQDRFEIEQGFHRIFNYSSSSILILTELD